MSYGGNIIAPILLLTTCVCLSIHNKKRDFGAKGQYNMGMREVHERSDVFIIYGGGIFESGQGNVTVPLEINAHSDALNQWG